jgi:hypothetical protein bfra3_16283
MELTKELKGRTLEAILADRANYPSDSKHATALGISPSVYNALKKGKLEKQLSETAWLSIARRLNVPLRGEIEWKVAPTATYDYVTGQLEACQERSLSALLCDLPNIGKTFSARQYARTHKNVVYVDCSQVKTKVRLVRQIALGFGLEAKGRYEEIYANLVYYVKSLHQPLIILDEAGDLQYEAFLELKALWNALENACGWYMMGADGLRAKIERSIDCRKVGYTELFSRFGDAYRQVTPLDGEERKNFLLRQVVEVAKLNAPEGVDAVSLARKSGSLRRAYTEIEKLKLQAGA